MSHKNHKKQRDYVSWRWGKGENIALIVVLLSLEVVVTREFRPTRSNMNLLRSLQVHSVKTIQRTLFRQVLRRQVEIEGICSMLEVCQQVHAGSFF